MSDPGATDRAPSPPIDHQERERLRSEFDRTFFVEAGAGTGKTTALVSRIVALVAADKLEMDRLAAITFTEAAAAELRDRVRRGLEKAARDEALDDIARRRCQVAADRVDLATIQTIHAFAGTILRTFPIEAGLPPGFDVWDGVQSSLAFEEHFRTWLYDEVPTDRPEGRARRDTIRRALLLGLGFDQMRDLAAALEAQTDLLTEDTTWPSDEPPDPRELAHRWGKHLLGLKDLLTLARRGEADPLAREVRRVQFAASRLADARTEEDALVALQGFGQPSLNAGKMADWDNEPGGANPVRVIRETFRSSRSEIGAALTAHRAAVLGALLGHLRDFTLGFARDRRQQGAATFHDLLTWARDLLRDDLEVRAQAQRRFDRIFVDEFQDTDPLQAEIVWFLAADPGVPAAADWRDVKLLPGKLFVVGDPKQSIYRFRRADIALYTWIFDQAESGARARLVQNFRSVSPVLDWVNFHFQRGMLANAGIQADYVGLHPAPHLADFGDRCHGVYTIGGPVEGGAEVVWSAEAEHVAAVARRAVTEGWTVRDAEGQLRSARYADVCVLMPSRTNVRRLEDAFEQHGVPYRIESGSLVLATQEVRDLLACLRAIDDPSDQVALVAALRSPAYACSDVDLLSWAEAGGRLDYEQPRDGLDGPVADALASLERFHGARADRSPAATIEAFVRERMLAIQVFGQPRPREAWRRIRYVVAQARALASAGRPTLRALVDWLEGLQRVGDRDPESPMPEADEDAVRLLTIHGAKGLEFPIVVLTGLGSRNHGPAGSVQILPNRSAGTLDVRCGSFQTPDYEAAKETEKLMDEAERIRLLYVAATRARDHLVLSLFHNKDGCHAARIAEVLKDYVSAGYHALVDDESAQVKRVSPLPRPLAFCQGERELDDEPTPDEHAVDELRWQERRTSLIEALAQDSVVTATDLERRHADGPHPPAPSPFPMERGSGTAARSAAPPPRHLRWGGGEGVRPTPASPLFDDDLSPFPDDDFSATPSDGEPIRLGRAVHAVLEAMALPIDPGLDSLVESAARRFGVPERVEDLRRMARAVATSPIIREAAASARRWREVPVGVEVEGVLLQGRIDLLFERSDGSLAVVDAKTDQVDRDTVASRADTYRVQGGAYALAVERATGRRVSSVHFVFAALDGHTEAYLDAPALAVEARMLITSLGSPSVAGSVL